MTALLTSIEVFFSIVLVGFYHYTTSSDVLDTAEGEGQWGVTELNES